MLVLRKR